MEVKEKILVSACLLGRKCTYRGDHNYQKAVEELKQYYEIVPICPEVQGGMTTPRLPSEINGPYVYSSLNLDVTKYFNLGATVARLTAQRQGCKLAILKERSPSCGVHQIYDGTFTKTVIPGSGWTTRVLLEQGIEVFNENEISEVIARKK